LALLKGDNGKALRYPWSPDPYHPCSPSYAARTTHGIRKLTYTGAVLSGKDNPNMAGTMRAAIDTHGRSEAAGSGPVWVNMRGPAWPHITGPIWVNITGPVRPHIGGPTWVNITGPV